MCSNPCPIGGASERWRSEASGDARVRLRGAVRKKSGPTSGIADGVLSRGGDASRPVAKAMRWWQARGAKNMSLVGIENAITPLAQCICDTDTHMQTHMQTEAAGCEQMPPALE